jgi:hypothetical protein
LNALIGAVVALMRHLFVPKAPSHPRFGAWVGSWIAVVVLAVLAWAFWALVATVLWVAAGLGLLAAIGAGMLSGS